MAKYFITIAIFLSIIFSNINLYASEISDSTFTEFKQHNRLTVLTTADLMRSKNNNPSNINLSLCFIREIIIFQNKYMPVSAIFEGDISSPVHIEQRERSQTFLCLNSGLWFGKKTSENWSMSLCFSTGITLINTYIGINSTYKVNFTYQDFSILVKLQSIFSEKFNASVVGAGLAYTF
jgi:hypothetical protein